MNPKIQTFIEVLEAHIPDIEYSLDESDSETGTDFIDLKLDDIEIVVEFDPQKGFGMHNQEEPVFGEKPDFISKVSGEAARAVVGEFEKLKAQSQN